MKHAATQSNERSQGNHPKSFSPVFDSRKRKIVGLWLRGNRYYAQLRVDLGNGHTAPRRLALDASNLEEAKGELERKRTERRDGKLPEIGYRPKFADLAQEYINGPTLAQKKPGTRDNERQALARWTAHLGGVRVDKITATTIYGYRERRLTGGVSARTVNLDTVALRNVLKFAVERGLITQLPAVAQLKQRPSPKKPLLTLGKLHRLIGAASRKTTKNGALLQYYLRFLVLTGAREQETLSVRWTDVDFRRQTVTIGKDGLAKNSKERDVNFSPELAALLNAMSQERPPDCSWLFPSPRRGNQDIPAKSLRGSLNLARDQAGLPTVGFHDLRHFFASQCVMAGIDFMTISTWLGHSDGGILVGKVYGHLADTHKQAAAQRLTFFEGTER